MSLSSTQWRAGSPGKAKPNYTLDSRSTSEVAQKTPRAESDDFTCFAVTGVAFTMIGGFLSALLNSRLSCFVMEFLLEPDREYRRPIDVVAEERGAILGGKGICGMGMSDPETRKKLSEARWLQFKHQSEKRSWPLWKRLIHRFQPCSICNSEKLAQIESRGNTH